MLEAKITDILVVGASCDHRSYQHLFYASPDIHELVGAGV